MTSSEEQGWARAARDLDADGQALLAQARTWAQQRLQEQQGPSGDSAERHALGTLDILADMQLDATARAALVVATVMTDAEAAVRTGNRQDSLIQAFGTDVMRLARGYRALIRVGQATRDGAQAATASQNERLRKMLLAMAADLRIVLMRLAARLNALRSYAAQRQEPSLALAQETLDLYAPLANRLGVWQIKWELEDLAFRFMDPERYKQIARQLEQKRVGREAFVHDLIARLQSLLAEQGVQAEIQGRPKHIYSIWNKMRNKRLAFSELFDLHALRIIVADERSCYTVLGILHEHFTPLPDEFDDYIARPKPNGYRSLHTVVEDAEHRPIEVQVRTRDMHEFAEFGVAAHWRYKEAGRQGGQQRADSDYDRKLAWLRQLLAWGDDQQATRGAGASLDDDRIYVLTPQARVIELPAGATPVDFAYNVHTDLGHRCRGARIDGQIVPLHTRLQTGQTVEIIATKSGGPSRDWLNPQLGFLVSPRSRAKVRQWFNAIDIQARIAQGHGLVEKALQRKGKTAVNLDSLAQQCGFANVDDLYIAVAKDEFSLRHLEAVLEPKTEAASSTDLERALPAQADQSRREGKGDVLVVGVDALLTQFARCCRPAPPDPIRGFITRGRGVSVHRADCPSLLQLARNHPERMIEVDWGNQAADSRYAVDVLVTAHDRSALLRDLSEVFARLRLNVTGVNTLTRQSLARMVFTLEVTDGQQLGRALTALSEVNGVVSAERR